jgi:hypothetical protein
LLELRIELGLELDSELVLVEDIDVAGELVLEAEEIKASLVVPLNMIRVVGVGLAEDKRLE